MGLSVLGLLFAAIVLPDAATSVEKTAAKELQDAIRRMTGRSERIVSECTALDDRHYFVGATRAAAEISSGIWREDEILVSPHKRGTVLAGHPVRGPIYAVDVYLEEICGVRWWTSTDFPPAAAPEHS